MSQSPNNGKTVEQQIDEYTKLMCPCIDKEHLQAWLQKYLGFTLPDCKVTKYANSTPLDFVWLIYEAMIKGQPLNIMALSGRDASKTVSLSVVDLLSILHDQRSAIHLGMTQKQATRARAYLDKYIHKNSIINGMVVKENSKEITLNVNGEEVGLELLSCTPKAVQGGHAALLSYDELASTIEPMIVKGYRDSSGIPGASSKGKPAIVIRITSRQAGYSLAEEELEKAKNDPNSTIKVVKWTTIDAMERCPDERSGTTPTPLWVNLKRGKKYTEEEFAKLHPSEQEEYELTTETMDKCLKCPLAMYCQGAAKKQTSTSPLLRKIDDVIQKVVNSGSHEWVLSQIMSLEPSKEGLVYFEFDDFVHRPGWNKMWQVLTGDTVTDRPISRQEFVAETIRQKLTFIAGVDWGWSNPSTCVVMAIDSKDNIYVLEAIGGTYKSDPDWVEIIKQTIHSRYPVDMYLPDAENKSGIKIFRDNDLPVTEIDKGPGSVKAGINVVKRHIKIPGSNRDTKLFVAPDIVSTIDGTPGLVEEFKKYHKEIDIAGKILDDKNPAKEYDHYLDALRYALYWYFGKATGKALWPESPSAMSSANVTDLTQVAQIQGIQFKDNREDFKKMGRQDDNGDDDPKGGGGGGMDFTWT